MELLRPYLFMSRSSSSRFLSFPIPREIDNRSYPAVVQGWGCQNSASYFFWLWLWLWLWLLLLVEAKHFNRQRISSSRRGLMLTSVASLAGSLTGCMWQWYAYSSVLSVLNDKRRAAWSSSGYKNGRIDVSGSTTVTKGLIASRKDSAKLRKISWYCWTCCNVHFNL